MKQKLIFWAIITLFSFVFLYFPPQVFAADVVINEFMANPNSGEDEWVEFYNPEATNMSSYWIDDDTDFSSDSGNGTKKSLSTIDITNISFPSFTLSSSLFNNTCNDDVCDYVVLFSSDGSIIDKYQYKSDQIKEKGKSIGRSPDSSSNWVILTTATKGSANSPALPTATSTPTEIPTPTRNPTPTKTPTPTPTSKPTATPKVTQASSFTPTPTVKVVAPTLAKMAVQESFEEKEDVGPTSILGEMVTVSPSAVPTEVTPKPEKSFFNFPKIAIGLGFIFLSASGILAFRNWKRSQEDDYR